MTQTDKDFNIDSLTISGRDSHLLNQDPFLQ